MLDLCRLAACGSALSLACVAGEPVPAPRADASSPTPVAERPESPPAEPVAAPPPLVPEPPPRSAIRPGIQVDPAVQPGLLQFADALTEQGSAGSLWIGPLEGNGGRDVLIHLPPGADDAADVELVYHFHGTYSEHIEPQREGLEKRKWVGWNRLEQTLAAIADLHKQRPNVALIYPFSAGKRNAPGARGWWNKAYDLMWMAPVAPPDYRDDFSQLHREVSAVLVDDFGVHPSKLPQRVLAEGHSAGGVALYNIAAHGSELVDEYLFLDAGFQDWADGCYAALRERQSSALVTLVITEGGIADPIQGRDPWCTELERAHTSWPELRERCEGAPQRRATGFDLSCAELHEQAEAWPDYRDWCEGMKSDMQHVPGVRVVRTRVYHGDQPRQFSGGLGLPEETAARLQPDPQPDPL